MSQLSRPYQVALAVLALFAAVWFVALRGHSQGGQTPSTAATQPAAPGMKGLHHAVERAHGAAKTAEQNAAELERRSEQASSPSSSSSSSSHAARPSGSASQGATGVHPGSHGTPAHSPSHAAAGAPAGQRAVEAELARGKVVAVLFWNPKGADDVAVHREVQRLASGQGGVAAHYASAGQVASYGSITRGVQVYGTPTLLLIGHEGRTVTLTGLTDGFAIRQAIAEVRKR